MSCFNWPKTWLLSLVLSSTAQAAVNLSLPNYPSEQSLNATQRSRLNDLREKTDAKPIIVRFATTTAKADLFSLRIPEGNSIELKALKSDVDSEIRRAIGAAKDDSSVELSYAEGDNYIIGTIRTPTGVYAIRHLGGGVHAILERNKDVVPPDHPPGYSEGGIEKADPLPPDESPVNPAPANPQMDAFPAAAATVDVLVVFTRDFSTMFTGDESKKYAEILVSDANKFNKESDVNSRLRLVGVTLLDQPSTSSSETMVKQLVKLGDGKYDEVHALRDEKNADIVVMIARPADACGIAGKIGADAATAFAVVAEACAHDRVSFAHEIGHLHGARHDPATDSENVPFRHGHGYRLPNSMHYTIMAYPPPDCHAPCPRTPRWSTPLRNHYLPPNTPMGDAVCCHDARVIDATASKLASFKP